MFSKLIILPSGVYYILNIIFEIQFILLKGLKVEELKGFSSTASLRGARATKQSNLRK